MKVLFFGSSEYCLPILESLKINLELIGIITKAGHPVEKFALSHNIDVFTPRGNEELSNLKEIIIKHNPDLAIVADYGLIIPKNIFSLPRYKTLNIHFSRLPKFRGPSPVQYTILNGEKSAWISVIIMDSQVDTGDIVWQKEVPLEGNEASSHLYQKLFNKVALDLPEILNKYVQNELKPQKQDNSRATYTKHLQRKDGFIPSYLISAAIESKSEVKINAADLPKDSLLFSAMKHLPAQAGCNIVSLCIERALRAFTPWPGLWTEIEMKQLSNDTMTQKKRLKIIKAHLEQSTIFVPDLVQLEGKKPVSWKQFRDGYPNISF